MAIARSTGQGRPATTTRPSVTTDRAIPSSTKGSCTPATPKTPPRAITNTNVAGTAHSARPPSCAANRPTATIASTWSSPPMGCMKPCAKPTVPPTPVWAHAAAGARASAAATMVAGILAGVDMVLLLVVA